MDPIQVEQMRHGWLMFYITVVAFFGWTTALACMQGKKIFWDYEKFPDEHQSK